MNAIAWIRRKLIGPQLTADQLCDRKIDHEGANEEITAKAKARWRRHVARGMTHGHAMSLVIPWLRVEKRKGVVS